MKIAIGCDNLGAGLKEALKKRLNELGHAAEDFGEDKDGKTIYPDIALAVAGSVKDGRADRGILICGTGIGMAISANKVEGVYAAVCHDLYSTQRSILSNDINVMCMGALVIGERTAVALLDVWLDLTFKESPSLEKINRIKEIEHTGK